MTVSNENLNGGEFYVVIIAIINNSTLIDGIFLYG